MIRKVRTSNRGFAAARDTLQQIAVRFGLANNNGLAAQRDTLNEIADITNLNADEIERRLAALEARPF